MHLGFKVYYSKDYFSLPTNKDDFGAEARGLWRPPHLPTPNASTDNWLTIKSFHFYTIFSIKLYPYQLTKKKLKI